MLSAENWHLIAGAARYANGVYAVAGWDRGDDIRLQTARRATPNANEEGINVVAGGFEATSHLGRGLVRSRGSDGAGCSVSSLTWSRSASRGQMFAVAVGANRTASGWNWQSDPAEPERRRQGVAWRV